MTDGRATPAFTRRRSRRIALAVPVFVSAHKPPKDFSETCETIWVSTHGCSMRSPKKLEIGDVVRMDIPHSDRKSYARVVHSEPVGNSWILGMELEKAENFWRVRFPPEDWAPQVTGILSEAEAKPIAPEQPPAATSPEPAEERKQEELAARLQAADSLLEEMRQTRSELQSLIKEVTEQLETQRQQRAAEQAAREETSSALSREILEAELRGLGQQWMDEMRQELSTEFGERRLELYARASEFFESKAREVTDQACQSLQVKFKEALEALARVLQEKLGRG